MSEEKFLVAKVMDAKTGEIIDEIYAGDYVIH